MQIARWNRGPGGRVPAGSTKILGAEAYNKTILLDTLTGSVVTLPKAVGSGARLKFVETLAATSNSHIIKVRDSVDIFIGEVTVSGTTSASFPANGTTHDTITFNRTTTGGATRGAILEMEDVAPGVWHVTGVTAGSGAVATPFSATV